MNKDNKHMEKLEEFYRSTFDSAEMDVPSAFTDSLIGTLQEKGINKSVKERLSDKIGAHKLYRFLQVSLIFNLITVSTIGYYLLNNTQEVIKIETPISDVIINENTNSKPAVNTQLIEKKTKSDKVTDAPISVPVHAPINRVTENVLVNEDSEYNNEGVKGSNDSTLLEPFPEKLSTTRKDTVKVESNRTEPKNDGPANLNDLRNRYKDTLKGKPLFNEK